MKSLDTNVIIRFLINDDKEQGNRVRILFEKAEKKGDIFFITIPVLLETLWVLDSVYNFIRDEIIDAVESLSLMPIIEFEKADTVPKFIRISKKTDHKLDDMLIGVVALDSGCESTITFDLNASKSDLFELLK